MSIRIVSLSTDTTATDDVHTPQPAKGIRRFLPAVIRWVSYFLSLAGIGLTVWAFRQIDSPIAQSFEVFLTTNKRQILFSVLGLGLFFLGSLGGGDAQWVGFRGVRRKRTASADQATGESKPSLRKRFETSRAVGILRGVTGGLIAAAAIYAYLSVYDRYAKREFDWDLHQALLKSIGIGILGLWVAGAAGVKIELSRISWMWRPRWNSPLKGWRKWLGIGWALGRWSLGILALYRSGVLFANLVGYGKVAGEIRENPVGMQQGANFIESLTLFVVGLALLEARRRRSWFTDLGFGRGQAGLPWWRRDAFWLPLVLSGWVIGLSLNLDKYPSFFHGDEATVVQYGRCIYTTDPGETFFGPEFNTPFREDMKMNQSLWVTSYAPYLGCLTRGMAMELYAPERPYLGSRLHSVIVSGFQLALFFMLGRALFGRVAAWLALVLLASSHSFIAFSRMGILNVDGLFFISLWGLSWVGFFRSRRISMAGLCGALSGFGIYTYPATLLAVPLFGAYLLIHLIRDPKMLVRRWAGILIFFIAYFAGTRPMNVYYRNNPGGMRFRSDAVFALHKRNLDVLFPGYKADTLPELMVKYSWPAFGGILLWNDASSNYGFNGLPVTDRETTALMLLGLVGAVALWRRARGFELLLLWWLVGMVFGSWLTTSPPPPYLPRTLVVLPAAYLLASWVLSDVLRRSHRLGWWFLSVPVALAIAFGTYRIADRNLRTYFVDYAPNKKLHGYNITPMAFMELLNRMPRGASMALFADHYDQMYTACCAMFDWGWPRILAYDPTTPIPEPNPLTRQTVYVVRLIEKYQHIDAALKARFPKARVEDLVSPYVGGGPRFRAYWVDRPPQTAASVIRPPGVKVPGAQPAAARPSAAPATTTGGPSTPARNGVASPAAPAGARPTPVPPARSQPTPVPTPGAAQRTPAPPARTPVPTPALVRPPAAVSMPTPAPSARTPVPPAQTPQPTPLR